MLYGIAMLFLLLAVLIFSGKGGWLIAGYNTAAQAEKEKYDEPRLFRAMGTLCVVLAVLIGLMALLEKEAYAGIYGGLVVASVAATLIYVNTKCRKQ